MHKLLSVVDQMQQLNRTCSHWSRDHPRTLSTPAQSVTGGGERPGPLFFRRAGTKCKLNQPCFNCMIVMLMLHNSVSNAIFFVC